MPWGCPRQARQAGFGLPRLPGQRKAPAKTMQGRRHVPPFISMPLPCKGTILMSDLHTASLLEIRSRLAAGEVRAEDVARACLERIKATEPSLHALLAVREEALEEATCKPVTESYLYLFQYGKPVKVE